MKSIVKTRLLPAVTGIVTGSVLSGLVLGLDEFRLVTVGIPPQNARALLGATFAAVVTAGAFAFWMRPIAAQLASSAVPYRLVVDRLDDAFQRRTIAVTVGALSYEATVLLALPTSGDASAPPMATLVGAVVGVGAIAGLLVAMHHAERSTRPSVLLGEAARAVVRRIQDSAGTAGRQAAESPPATEPSMTVNAPATGWVRDLDAEQVLGALPSGATVRIELDVGSFVISGWTLLASVWCSETVDGDVAPSIAASFDIGDERAESKDLAGSLSQFVDIGVHAAVGGSARPSTVYETMWHLGAILHELGRHELSDGDRQSDGGVTLIRRRTDASQLVDLAVDRIRQVTASQPQTALELIRVLCDARQAAVARERWDIVEVLDDQCDRVVAQCEHAAELPSDVARVAAVWRAGGSSETAGTRAEEYPSTETSDEETVRAGDGSVGARR